MPFDPAADPWGTAMLAAAALWVLSLLVVMIALVVRTSAQTGARLMIVALVGFLVSAAGGTWERVRRTDTTAAQPPPPAPTVIVAPDPYAAPSRGDAGAEASAGDEASTTGGDPGATDEGRETDPPDPDPRPSAEPESAAALPTVDPLPSEPEALDAAIRARLREAADVADDRRACATLDELARAWATLRTVPSEAPWATRARAVAEDLEQCRRRLLYSISRRHRRTQIDARDALAATLADRLREEKDLRVAVALSGKSHERLRIGGTGLGAAEADALMDDGLRAELRALAFANVVISDGKGNQTYRFETTPEGELGLPDLRAVGLGEPLVLAAPP